MNAYCTCCKLYIFDIINFKHLLLTETNILSTHLHTTYCTQLPGLEQLCKVAMVSSGGLSGCVNVTRMLVNQGRPMYNIDAKSLQVQFVQSHSCFS